MIGAPRKSVADPENVILSPVRQVVPALGVPIVTDGGVPAVTVTVSVSDSPP